MTTSLIQTIAAASKIQLTRYEAVSGGDINECWCLHSTTSAYFLKLNDADRFPAMFEMEADGLEALRMNSTIAVPRVMQQGIVNNKQWLLLDWINKGVPNKKSPENFGAALAAMHKKSQPYFGWPKDNYIGSLQQINTPSNNWSDFYSHCRVMPLIKILFDTGVFTKTDTDAAAAFCKNFAGLFPVESPALLHGDLWGGNYMINTNGIAVMYDPAVYNGHREMDIGMTKLFGGFSQSFYDAYHEAYPLEQGWQQRIFLTQLYPLLVHAVLFGGHYVMSVREIIGKF